ncbi:hypothetical protein DTO013E5_10197 [Penicillium roqueforti]|uniref:Peptidoglycan-binding lysin domain n=1 Tax=Penicillium roqueforti (strain FM164) TaxID=1365484 RepID=W6R7W9_PENRF|nr:uncharacterized protein LCP9604111_3824 [Penicillium roqueforti]CDM37952.1 Peptidoglycan-binding lysin domain [Penicillium roqueforti FM164]KAF9249724.1 hypothetical protein LCP9604111_3824 [Penicillium roqueforti]KAI1829814.1 hypothetical protein CBS147337_9321 [Penicillium roqueforti]KAI2669869.1 hypothetical protein CBS147355_9599 [Penicillium roqueforti]KAI2685044.1 hypothetical protein LCP963914a_5136 [Penicillium roqueforti]
MRGMWTAPWALLISTALAQQPAGIRGFTSYPGLTDGCKEALSTNVSCPAFLPVVSPDNSLLDGDQVDELCVDTCYSSLKSARATIKAACSETTDVIVVEDVAYPATFIADKYMLTYDISCRKDESGGYCDPQLLSWSNGSWPVNGSCSDCWLGTLETQLNSPLGYDEGVADSFTSLTSSCSATGYSVTSPTAYALNATATATSSPATSSATTSCENYYQVKETDDCNSVAKSLGVSTYYLLQTNDLDLYCQNFAAKVNQTLCVPSQCTTHTWQADDTCDSVVGGLANVTLPQFFSWNPNINSLCLNAIFFIGYEVCVSPPSGYLNQTAGGSDSSATETGVATGIAAVPTNAMDNSNRNCSQWYTVQKGDECAKVSLAHSISLTDFYFLNPEIDANCTNLLLDEAYCVKAVGSITSYANYTVTGVLPITVTPVNFTNVNTDIPTATSDPGYVYTGAALLPTASGTIPDCYDYENPSNYTSECVAMATFWGITMKQMVTWNPSLVNNASTCELNKENSYCILRYENSTASTEDTDSGLCLPMNATEAGTAFNCNCFTSVDLSYSDVYTCDDIIYDYSLTMDDLVSWNSWLEGDCDTALYASLNATDDRAICIGVGSAAATTTASGTATQTPTTTSSSSSMGPTPTDTVSGCEKFYTTTKGDDCATVETKFSITLAQFYQWNPSVGSTCTNLWLGEAYCVKGPASTTSATASAPTQTGIASNCNQYYTVVSNDSCAKIETAYGITFAELYKWNPAIGSDCEYLGVGYSVCVGVSS